MKILFVEDDDIKANVILDYIQNEISETHEIIRKHSWQGGIIEIIKKSNMYNMILLDMSMPRYDSDVGDVNEEFEAFAGWDIIKEMNRRGIVIPTCVITSFDYFGENDEIIDGHTLDEKLKEEFPNIYMGMIYFNSSQMIWKENLLQKLKLGENK
ncbi:hypothetical protein COE82_18450 [Bacillus wiedmannii]|uniref:response regulator n=1 Tax=Bacillus wiedmannii TaxID=1890302 RepID=UPI000BFCE1EF|nr:response regulator [Bacillus wiedmannii]PHB39294.1 hypothetical protein COE82_18450 [Bacillus wiedmannii]